MKIQLKITKVLLENVQADLERPHPFTAERVAFIGCKVATFQPNGVLVLGQTLHSLEDDDYLKNSHVGAMMGPSAIRKALQVAYREPLAMFHVHMHNHSGEPWFSRIDLTEASNFVPDFWHVRPDFPHGAIVLSCDSMAGLCWIPGLQKPVRISEFTIVGAPMRFIRGIV